jgi:cytoskeletal protein CcmA (bactofilin family)
MFRRKEDEVSQDLLGNTEAAMASGTESADTAEAARAAASPAPVAATNAPYTRTPAAAPTAATPVYRPAAAPAAEAARARMPEYRPANSPLPSSLTQAANSAFDKNKAGNRRVLTVGNDILLKGEIATCDRLVIEGAVDATLKEVHTVEIAEGGSFKGYAEIEDAEISGLFEGELVVRNRLVIYATGKVRGKITYGEIEIERGGELTGDIKTVDQLSAKPAGKKTLEAA